MAARPTFGSLIRAARQLRVDNGLALLWLAALVASASLVTRWLPQPAGTLGWAIDLVAHWQWPALLAGLGSAAWLAFRGRLLAPLPALLLVLPGWALSSAALDRAEAKGSRFVLASANLQGDHADLAAFRTWLARDPPDALVLSEVSPRVAAALGAWTEFPYQALHAEEGPFGIALLSRHSLADVQLHDPLAATPHYRATLLWQGRMIALAALHPMPPLSPRYDAQRRQLLEELAEWIAGRDLPGLLAGDLNATPWSSSLHAAERAGLRRATSTAPTWPAAFPLLPIDHVLASPHWSLLGREIGPAIGSDHRPLRVVLQLDGRALPR